MLSNKAKRELKIDQRQILIDSIEIGISSPQQICLWGSRQLPNGKKVGLVKNSKTVNYKRFTPFRDGLFCERIFGPVTSFVCACGKKQPHSKVTFCEKCEVEYIDQRSRRYRLGYISLLSPVTHIWYLKGRPSYLSLFLGKRKKTIVALAYCNAYLIELSYFKKDNEMHIWPFMSSHYNPENLLQHNLYKSSCNSTCNGLQSEALYVQKGKQSRRSITLLPVAPPVQRDAPNHVRGLQSGALYVQRKECAFVEGNASLADDRSLCLHRRCTALANKKRPHKRAYIYQEVFPKVRFDTPCSSLLTNLVAYKAELCKNHVLCKASHVPTFVASQTGTVCVGELCNGLQSGALYVQKGKQSKASHAPNLACAPEVRANPVCTEGAKGEQSFAKNVDVLCKPGKEAKLCNGLQTQFAYKAELWKNHVLCKAELCLHRRCTGFTNRRFVLGRFVRATNSDQLLPWYTSSSKKRTPENFVRSFQTSGVPANRCKPRLCTRGASKAELCKERGTLERSCKREAESVLQSSALQRTCLRQALESFTKPKNFEEKGIHLSTSYSAYSYVRHHALPFLPTFVSHFYLRDALLHFIYSSAAYTDIPLMEYCQNKRLEPLQDVHKLMARQSVDQFKTDLPYVRSLSSCLDSIQNRNFSQRLKKTGSSNSSYNLKTEVRSYKVFKNCGIPTRKKRKVKTWLASSVFAPSYKAELWAHQQATGFVSFVRKVQRTDAKLCNANKVTNILRNIKLIIEFNKKSFRFQNSKIFHYTGIISFIYPFTLSPKIIEKLATVNLYLRQTKKYNLILFYFWKASVNFNQKYFKSFVRQEFAQTCVEPTKQKQRAQKLKQVKINDKKDDLSLTNQRFVSDASLSHLELTTIREILSYTGGGALQQLLQQFDQHDLCKFLFAEKQILRVLYQKHNKFVLGTDAHTNPVCTEGAKGKRSFIPHVPTRRCLQTLFAPKGQKGSKALFAPRPANLACAPLQTEGLYVQANPVCTEGAKGERSFAKNVASFVLGRAAEVCKERDSYKASHAPNYVPCKPLLPLRHVLCKAELCNGEVCNGLQTQFAYKAELCKNHLLCNSTFFAKRSFAYKSKICMPTLLPYPRLCTFTNRRFVRASKGKVQRGSRVDVANLCSPFGFANNVPLYAQSHEYVKVRTSEVYTKFVKQAKRCDLQKKQVIRVSRRIYKVARRLKVVQLLTLNHRRPEWMILSHLPVLPPDLRPILQMSEKVIVASDLNIMYQRVIYRNNRHLRVRFIDFHLVTAIQRLVQDAVDRLIENGKGGSKPYYTQGGRPLKSLSDILKGKKGRFRLNLLGKRVDFSGRSVIVVAPTLKIHECGLPKDIALELYHYFLLRQLIVKKYCASIVTAKKMIKSKSSLMWNILRELMYHHPVLLNRAPTLHRLGIQAFQPKLVLGNAIWLHPLVCSGFNADFDGDQMGVHLPLSFAARAESWDLLWSRNNLLSPATGQPMLVPSQDMVLGFYYMTAKAISLLPTEQVKARSLQSSPVHQRYKQTLFAPKVQKGSRALQKTSTFFANPVCTEGAKGKRSFACTYKPSVCKGAQARSGALASKQSLQRRVLKTVSFQNKNYLFLNTGSIVTSLQNGVIKLHTPVWLYWNGRVENENVSQLPLELRVHSFGVQRYVYEKYINSNLFKKTKTSDYYYYKGIHDKDKLLKEREKSIKVLPFYQQHQKCKVNFVPRAKHVENVNKEIFNVELDTFAYKASLIQKERAIFSYLICAEPKTYYIRTTAGRVLMNTIMKV